MARIWITSSYSNLFGAMIPFEGSYHFPACVCLWYWDKNKTHHQYDRIFVKVEAAHTIRRCKRVVHLYIERERESLSDLEKLSKGYCPSDDGCFGPTNLWYSLEVPNAHWTGVQVAQILETYTMYELGAALDLFRMWQIGIGADQLVWPLLIARQSAFPRWN